MIVRWATILDTGRTQDILPRCYGNASCCAFLLYILRLGLPSKHALLLLQWRLRNSFGSTNNKM